MVLLATATSLPELGTGVSAIGLQDSPDLAAGAAFGSNLVNILIIGLADLVWRNGPLLSHVPKASLLVAGLGAAVILIASIATLVHHGTTTMNGWYVSPFTVVLFIFFLVATFTVYRFEKVTPSDSPAVEVNQDRDNLGSKPTRPLSTAIIIYLGSAAIVIASSVWLAHAGDGLADQLGWDESFVGTQFLAISTSLPEMATTLAALRLGSPGLAVGNLLGSNLFNMGFILSADELVLTQGSIWGSISQSHALTGIIALAMTAVVVAAILYRSRSGRESAPSRVRPEAILLIGIYVAASVSFFYIG